MNFRAYLRSPAFRPFYRAGMQIVRTGPVSVGGKDRQVAGTPIPIKGGALVMPYGVAVANGGNISTLTPAGEESRREMLMLSGTETPLLDSDAIVDSGSGEKYVVISAKNMGEHYETALRLT